MIKYHNLKFIILKYTYTIMNHTKRHYRKKKHLGSRRKANHHKRRTRRLRRNRKHRQYGGSKCAHMREDSNYTIMGKLVCAYSNGEKELYMQVVMNIINKGPTRFIRYVYDNYTTFKPYTRQALGQAFVTFQEDAIKTYNLEHILPGYADDSMLMPRDW